MNHTLSIYVTQYFQKLSWLVMSRSNQLTDKVSESNFEMENAT